MLDTIKVVFDLILGWSIICLLIEGFTGWGRNGQYKKVVLASFAVVSIIVVIYILIRLIFRIFN